MVLEEFACLVEQHHGYGLKVVSAPFVQGEREGPGRGYRHEEVLVEYMTLDDVAGSPCENVVSYEQIYCEVGDEFDHTLYVKKVQ